MDAYLNGILLSAEKMEPRLFNLDLQLLTDAGLTLIAIFTLYLALSYFLFNPAREMLKKREEKIATELSDAKTALSDANNLEIEYKEKLANINAEADGILAEARKKALANENSIIADAKEEAHRIMEHARKEAELEKKKVADEVKTEMVSLASIMAGKVVAANITTDIQDTLIEDTLKEMGESTWLS